MAKNLEIKKLADVVVWFDDWIEETKLDLTEEEMEDDETIKEFETIKKVILDAIERHNVYTNALNKDIVAKDAKIELMQKELDGRKAAYVALKARMDSDDICNTYKNKVDTLEKELADCKVKIRHQKENLNAINKTLEIRTKENERLIAVKNSQEKEIEAHEAENARLSKRIMNLRKENGDYVIRVNKLKKELDRVYGVAFAPAHQEDDDHGRAGFKRYIEYLIEEEERAVPERFKERLNEEITAIFEKEEETEVKGVHRMSSGRYPWGAKVNDIPCGSDSIE